MITREEHLEMCKRRARERLGSGNLEATVTGMLADLKGHPDNAAVGKAAMPVGRLYAKRGDREGVRRWVEGFR